MLRNHSRVALGFMFVLSLSGCVEKKAGPAAGSEQPAMSTLPGCDGAVLPDLKTIESGEYSPLSRPLFLYVNKTALKKPEVAAYLKVALNQAQEQIEGSGFIKLNPKVLKEQQDKLNEAIAGVTIPEKLESGNVAVDGSSTVFPFSVVAAELFQKAHDDKVNVTVGKKGTGGGFERFCAGETDISNASRPIKDSEVKKATEHGVEFLELSVCIDGLSVCVNPRNDWCYCLSVEQLKKLWEPGSKIKKWNELDPSWPDAEIKLYGADADSGTFDYFTEVIVGKSKSSRSDYTPSSEDNVLVKGVTGDKYALGYFGYSYYDKNRKQLRAVGIKPAGKNAEAKPVAAAKADEKSSDKDAKAVESKSDEKQPEPVQK